MPNKITKQQFVKKARVAHGNKYDYSMVAYKGSKIPVTIVCPRHGIFSQKPNNHYHQGCPKCGTLRMANLCRKTKNQFVRDAIAKHGDKYDYSRVNYKNNRTDVEIICPYHGIFQQMPGNHMKFGCKKCGNKNMSLVQRKSLEAFREEAVKIHGNKYNYSDSVYSGAHKKMLIGCNLHGPFLQTPRSHLNGSGCPECKQGKNHPRFGKPPASSGYFGWYHENIFRSLPELFWMIDAEINDVDFIGMDQPGNRKLWQVYVLTSEGKDSTYCADFFLPHLNKVIDIKPKWREKRQQFKLSQGREAYTKRGYVFEIVDSDTIKVQISKFKKLVRCGDVNLYPASQKRFEKRFG